MTNFSECNCLVSPKTRRTLNPAGNGTLQTPEADEVFPVLDGIVHLIDFDELGDVQLHEKNIFDEISIRGIPYFRKGLFRQMARMLRSMVVPVGPERDGGLKAVEMGGGEGYWAQQVKTEFPAAEVFVCDLSAETLRTAPKNLNRICADISRPVFEQGTMDLVSFWVSLHHLNEEQREKALRESTTALKEGGILLVFEPNNSFFLRQLLYRTRLGNDVYPDQREQALDFSGIAGLCEKNGMRQIKACFLNPPYNPHFVKRLKNGWIYFIAVEVLYLLDQWLVTPFFKIPLISRGEKYRKYFSLYGLVIYRK